MQPADWNDAGQRCIGVHLGAATIARDAGGHDVLALFNASDRPVEFVLPAAARDPAWRELFDTAGAAQAAARILPCRTTLAIESRSVILLEAHEGIAPAVAQDGADRVAGAPDAG
jgi:pullulanase/glycogen debranching enzyme